MKNELKLLKQAENYRDRLHRTIDKIKNGKSNLYSDKFAYFYAIDLSDHLRLCNYILEKKYRIAHNFLWDLDTNSREELPKGIFEALEFDDLDNW